MSDKYLEFLHESKEEDDIKKAIEKTKLDYKKKRKEIKKKIADARLKFAEHAETVGHTFAKQVLESFEEELVELQEKFVERMGELLSKLKLIQARKGVKLTVATIAVSTILIASYQLYKKYIKTYQLQCKSYQGTDKILCYRRARIKALQQRIIYLKQSVNRECRNTRDPVRCKLRIAKEIEKLSLKVEKYRELI